MVYPYKHRNRSQGVDEIELHKLGTDSGTGVTHTAALTAGVSTDINLPYNAWQVNGVFWADNFNENLTLKIFPYVNHAQTIDGPAYFMSQPGATAAASVITLAATDTGSAGAVFRVLGGIAGGGATTQQYDNLTPIHGMKVVVTSADTITTAGTHDWELVCVPEV